MSLEHAILGFLTYRPLSGYDLKKFFDESVRHFWSATQSQIYRTLARMSETGWIEMEHIEQEDRPDRKVYHITNEGRDELRHWLTTPLDLPAIRHKWLVQVFFADQLSDEETITLFEAHAERLRQKLALFRNGVQEVVERRFTEGGSKRSRRLWQFTLDYGIAHLEWELQWIENALKDLRYLPSD
ncbi:MAG: PadR family transcriptional regulator [Anaerolineaceae bacterium]|nr:PadR family transcriptional regulator [Anaerolineaceae bacterium]